MGVSHLNRMTGPGIAKPYLLRGVGLNADRNNLSLPDLHVDLVAVLDGDRSVRIPVCGPRGNDAQETVVVLDEGSLERVGKDAYLFDVKLGSHEACEAGWVGLISLSEREN